MKLSIQQKNLATASLEHGQLPSLTEEHDPHELSEFIIAWIETEIKKNQYHSILPTLLINIISTDINLLKTIERVNNRLFSKIILSKDMRGYTLFSKVILLNCPIEIINWLVAHGADLHWRHTLDPNCTLVHYAASSNSVNGLETLKTLDPDAFNKALKIKNAVGATPLLLAVLGDHQECVEWFIRNTPEIDCVEFSYILKNSAGPHTLSVLEKLKKINADTFKKALNLLTADDYAALFSTAYKNRAAVIDFLIKNGADIINWRRPKDPNYSLFHLAAGENAVEGLETLKTLNPDAFNKALKIKDAAGATPLLRAVLGGHPECVEWFIRNTPEIDCVEFSYILKNAAANNALSMLEKLKELKVDTFRKALNLIDADDGFTALSSAVYKNRAAVVDFLIQNGADINWQHPNNPNYTLFHLAAGENAVEGLETLKTLNPDAFNKALKIKDAAGATPLLRAVLGGHPECVEWFIRNTPEIDFAQFNTLLIKAADNDALSVLKKLKVLNPDTFKKAINLTADGYTALSHAVYKNRAAVVDFLIENGADINWRHPNDPNYTLFHLAAAENAADALGKLKTLNPDAFNKALTIKDCYGATPLTKAAIMNKPESFEWFIQNGAEIDNDQYNQLLNTAAANKAIKILDKLKNLDQAKVASSAPAPSQTTNSGVRLEVVWQGNVKSGSESHFGLISIELGGKSHHFKPPKENTNVPVLLKSLENVAILEVENTDAINSLTLTVYLDTPYESRNYGVRKWDNSIQFQQRIRREKDYVRFEENKEPIIIGHTYQLIIKNEDGFLRSCILDKNKPVVTSSQSNENNITFTEERNLEGAQSCGFK